MVSKEPLTQPIIILITYLGKVKSIGVSNFSQAKLEEILPTAEIVPAVNQVNRLFFSINM